MPTAIYKNELGERLPSVTGICSDGIGGLGYWYWERGTKGLPYKDDSATKAGEIGHLLVEATVKKLTVDPSTFPTDGAAELGMRAFQNYQRWQELTKIKWTDSEISLVSEKHQFGGTIDLIGVEEGSNAYALGDVKTGSVRPEHLMQLAAYGRLFEECTGYHIGQFHLLRFNRQTGDFQHHYFTDLDEAWEAFLLRRKLYDLMARLKKRV